MWDDYGITQSNAGLTRRAKVKVMQSGDENSSDAAEMSRG